MCTAAGTVSVLRPEGEAELSSRERETLNGCRAERAEMEDKMAELQVKAEGSGVAAMKARVELEQMRARSNTGQNMAEVRAGFQQRKAKKALDTADPAAEEMKRVAAAKAEAERKEKEEREASKARLKAKQAALFGGN